MVAVKHWSLIFITAMLFSFVTKAAVTVSVIPDSPSMEESFRIVYSVDEKLSETPDFSALQSLFEILRQNQSTQVQWINGKHSSSTTWELEVVPLKAGDLIIPAIVFGNSSSPPTPVTVRSANSANGAPQSDLLLEIDVDDNTPYVQQQVVLTVRLLRRLTLADAKLSDLETSGDVIVKPLSKDRTYQDERLGKRYEVFERRFAIFPQASGSLTIEPFNVTAQVSRGSRSLFDPFRSTTSTRRISSNTIQLEVQPVPTDFTGDTWLPARRLNLREEWEPAVDSVASGEPLTRTLYLLGDGLTAGQLPDFPMAKPGADLGGANIYPDQVQTNEQETETGFSALKQQKFAIIANNSELIEVPEISIPWWNIETDEMEIARTGARQIKVELPASSAPSDLAAPQGSDIVETPVEDNTFADEAKPESASSWWRPLAIVALLGWAATILIWWLQSRKSYLQQSDSASSVSAKINHRIVSLEKEVLRSADMNDPYATRKNLLTWANAVFEPHVYLSLGALAKELPTPLATQIKTLDSHLYANKTSSWLGEELRQAFQNTDLPKKNRGNNPPKRTGERSGDHLEPLFKLN